MRPDVATGITTPDENLPASPHGKSGDRPRADGRRGRMTAAPLRPPERRDGGACSPANRHRPDIDGLRALAVAAVILTHLQVHGFHGGFLGVDVFFVISGYLIFREILARVDDGTLSIAAFYARRMRRTVPALLVVMSVSLAVATTVLMPGELDDMARSLLGAVLFVSNIVFATQNGYFDQASAVKPLLHTWSLGVEAQFYLVAPVLALMLARLPRPGRRAALLMLGTASLAGCIALRRVSADAAFFAMPTRLFEFIVGGLAAEGLIAPIRRAWVAEATAATALATLAAVIALTSPATPLPGLLSLVPCVATAAIIHAGASHATLVGKASGVRAIAFLGTISYSLYLWHWPIIVLAQRAGLPFTPSTVVACGLLLFALSALTWRTVEQPFREPSSPLRKHASLLLPACGGSLCAVCALVLAGNGWPGRFPSTVASVASHYSDASRAPYREGRCFMTSKDRLASFDRSACLGLAADRPNVLLLGDSHAAHLWSGFREAWPDVNVLQATASGCKPRSDATGPPRCTELMRDMLDHFIPAHHLDAVVVAALWEADDVATLRRTVAALRPYTDRVIVFGPVPRYDQPASTLLARAMLHGALAGAASHLMAGVKPLDAAMREALTPLATYVSPYAILCPRDQCRMLATPGVPMQFDYHHFTREGAAWLMTTLRQQNPSLLGSRLLGPALPGPGLPGPGLPGPGLPGPGLPGPGLPGPSAINEQTVAGASDGLQEQRVGRVHLDLPSQAVHLDVDRALIAGAAGTAQRLP